MVYEGKDFNIPMKLAQHLAFTSCVLVYSCAIPDSIVALPFYYVTHYWLDKWMILRVGRVPPRFSILLNDRANNIFGFIIILHIVSSMWFFSVPEIFPQEVKTHITENLVTYYYVETLSVSGRLFNPNVSSYLLLLITTIGIFFVIEPVAREVSKVCCFKKPRRGQKIVNGTLRTYSEEKMNFSRENIGDFSYDMMKSKKYRRALLLLNQQDIDEADD
jgi:hypothetical protein